MNNLSKQPLNPSNYVWTKHFSRPQPISQWRAAHYANTQLNVLFTTPKQCPDPNPQTSPAEASVMSCDLQKQSLTGCLTRVQAQTQHWFGRIFQTEAIKQILTFCSQLTNQFEGGRSWHSKNTKTHTVNFLLGGLGTDARRLMAFITVGNSSRRVFKWVSRLHHLTCMCTGKA